MILLRGCWRPLQKGEIIIAGDRYHSGYSKEMCIVGEKTTGLGKKWSPYVYVPMERNVNNDFTQRQTVNIMANVN